MTEPHPGWTSAEASCLNDLLPLAVAEDVANGDLTSQALVPPGIRSSAQVVARQQGIVAGLPAVGAILAAYDAELSVELHLADGSAVQPQEPLCTIGGPAQLLLTAERVVLNVLTYLSGIATLTGQFVEQTAGTQAEIYDTRKTLPGWRRLAKYAVRCGGGRNQRVGLFDAVIIKDNHLAFGAQLSSAGLSSAGLSSAGQFTPAQAVQVARQRCPAGTFIQIEVDTLAQLSEVLPAAPDAVLLDNMPPALLSQAVNTRDQVAAGVLLEASGGVNLQTVRAIAQTGVDRISVGAMTHSAPILDLGLDWH